MTTIKSSFFLFLIVLLSSHCTHKYYAPNTANIPLLSQKGDAQLSGGLTFGDEMTAVELQGAYALTNKIGAQLNIMSVNMAGDADALYGEFALGRYFPLENNFGLEFYGGIGTGKITSFYGPNTGSSEVIVQKAYIQPNFGRKGKIFDFGITSKLAMVDLDWAVDETTFRNNNDLIYLAERRLFWRLEPAFQFGLGYKNIKLRANLGFALALNHPELSQEDVIGGFALYYTFH